MAAPSASLRAPLAKRPIETLTLTRKRCFLKGNVFALESVPTQERIVLPCRLELKASLRFRTHPFLLASLRGLRLPCESLNSSRPVKSLVPSLVRSGESGVRVKGQVNGQTTVI